MLGAIIVFSFSVALALRKANFVSRNIGLNQPFAVLPALHCRKTSSQKGGALQLFAFNMPPEIQEKTSQAANSSRVQETPKVKTLRDRCAAIGSRDLN